MKNILIIGGSGFISGHLAEALKSQCNLYIITRGIRKVSEELNHIMVNRDDIMSFSEAISKYELIWDVVFDCIGYRPDQVKQTINLFGASTKHYVFLSSDFAIPFYNNSSNYLQEFGYTQYGLNKKLCEEIIVGNNILPWTIFRSCHVYGVGSLLGCFPEHVRDKKLIETIVELGKVRLVDSGKYIQQPLYVDDLIRILIGCIDNKHTKDNIYTLSGPSTIYSNYYYLLLGKLLKKNVVIEYISRNQFLLAHPDQILFLQDRVYDDISKLRLSNLPVPCIEIHEGLSRYLEETG